jgi:(1->4)-alpha-D-glucan 1-alpha-D-glucosylmutase
MSGIALTATYRLQMNAGFTFEHARARVDYFAQLGISHLYLSPILAARRGSMHGYDVIDPARINPELGSDDDLRALSRDLHERGMGLIVDIVPNHMGIDADNPYWDDVLTRGERSRYARWFDIEWTTPDGRHTKLVLPILADDLDSVLERGELAVELREGETPRIVYQAHSFPVDPASLPPDLQLAQVDPEETGELADLYSGVEGRDRLHALLREQHYRLTDWRRGATEINYRRFFDVSDLVALRVEDPAVFDETHALMLRLVRDGVVDGLRVDHVDGLLDPRAYLERLRAATSPDTPIVVEKILSHGEQLSPSWPVQGTTGYEFLNDLEDVFHEPAGITEIETFYRRLRRLGATTFPEIARTGKASVLNGSLRADVDRLARLLSQIARSERRTWSAESVTAPLVAFIVALPVYRTYVDARTLPAESDRDVIRRSSAGAIANGAPREIIDFIADILLSSDTARTPERIEFAQRLQQLSAPATAKGVEDNALYVYVPLTSRNEIGGAPDQPLADAVERLHHANELRAERWPSALLATNTHDTKRSADVRARLGALTEIPYEWERAVRRWRKLNAKHRQTVRGRMAPDTNTEYLLYQILVALWPAPRAGRRSDDLPERAWRDSAKERLIRYALKAAREAKLRTSWIDNDAAYEHALTAFVSAILEPSDDAPFLSDVARLVSHIAPIGARNALSRIAVHLTSPGTPDIYQGDELWNFTLVDPDNRRPVDFEVRRKAMAELADVDERLHGDAPADLFDGRLKLLITQRLLHLRRTTADLFTQGEYRRVVVEGPRANHVLAYDRCLADRHCITVASRLTGSAVELPSDWWRDTTIQLPHSSTENRWYSEILGEELIAPNGRVEVGALLEKLPVAVLVN